MGGRLLVTKRRKEVGEARTREKREGDRERKEDDICQSQREWPMLAAKEQGQMVNRYGGHEASRRGPRQEGREEGWLCCCSERGSHVCQADLELPILLPLSPSVLGVQRCALGSTGTSQAILHLGLHRMIVSQSSASRL